MLSRIAAKFITLTLPTEKWFGTAFTLTRYFSYFIESPEERLKNSFRKVQSAKLDTLMSAIRASSPPLTEFPVPIKVQGAELLKEKYPNGLVVCSIHMPLVLLSVRLLIERGLIPDAILVKNVPKDGYLYVTGTKIRIPALFTDHYILVKVRSILRKGGIVIILVDDISKEATYFPNIFRLVNKLNSDLILTLVKLQGDGYIEGRIFDLPDTSSDEEENIKSKFDALHKHVTTVMSPTTEN
ncbi:hypothetical protein GCM10027299_41510 [Larkinella ripae]